MSNDSTGIGIPVSRRATCTYCACFIDSNGPGIYRRTIGWLPIGRFTHNRQGSNSLTLRESLNEYACKECVDKLKAGIPIGQQSLFSPQPYSDE